MKIRQVGAEFFYADGRMDRHDEANSRFSQLCERAWKGRKISIRPEGGRGSKGAVELGGA